MGLIGACLDESQLGKVAEAVTGALKEAGYLRAIVPAPSMSVVEEGRIPEPISLTFKTVEEGRRYRTQQIEWWFVTSFTPEQIRSVSTLRVGDILEPGKLRETVKNVKNMYRANGYPEASIVPEIKFIEPSVVSVKFSVTEGVRQ